MNELNKAPGGPGFVAAGRWPFWPTPTLNPSSERQKRQESFSAFSQADLVFRIQPRQVVGLRYLCQLAGCRQTAIPSQKTNKEVRDTTVSPLRYIVALRRRFQSCLEEHFRAGSGQSEHHVGKKSAEESTSCVEVERGVVGGGECIQTLINLRSSTSLVESS